MLFELPNNTDTYVKRGIVKAKLKYYESAILDYNKALNLNPNHVSVIKAKEIALNHLNIDEREIGKI